MRRFHTCSPVFPGSFFCTRRTPVRLLFLVASFWRFASAGQQTAGRPHLGTTHPLTDTVLHPSDTIPLGGNAWRMTAAGPGPIGDSAGGYIDNRGIEGWTDSNVFFDVWFRTSAPGDLQIWVVGSTPQGESMVATGPGIGARLNPVDIKGSDVRYYDAGTVTVMDTGYQRIRLRGLRRTGPIFADIRAIVLQGPALRGRMAFVPNDEGNFFHWGRRGPSVHLNYPLPANFDASWFYNEVTVPRGQDIQGSYFMACGFAQGYFGMQVNGPGERHILFSVWSPFQTDDPAAIPDSLRILLLQKGPEVHAGAFGQEGSGGQSYLNFPWKAGNTYRFLLHAAAAGDRNAAYTAWWFAPEEGRWRLIASFSRPRTKTGLTGLYSFLENFEPERGNLERYVLFNNGWAGDDSGHWVPLQRARFTVDNTGRLGYRLDFAGGVQDGSFYLKNDGFFEEFTQPGTMLRRPVDGGTRGPDIPLPKPLLP